MKTFIAISAVAISAFIFSCGGGPPSKEKETKTDDQGQTEDPESYDPKRGEGKYTELNLGLKPTLDPAKSKAGEEIAGVKCMSCHKASDEKLVGPGWKGVTQRRTPEWIMNFITNPDPMLNKDPEAKAMLELCLVRMPNQNLSDVEARNLLEYMRSIDGVK